MIDFGRPIPPSPAAPPRWCEAFAERDIEWHPSREVYELDTTRNVALLRDGGEMAYDLFLAVPVHRAPAVVVEAGMTKDGWIPVDAQTFETSYPGVYAMGDVAAVGTPRAGVFAEGHAAIAAQHIAARIRGETSSAQYGGRGICYVEFGADQVAMVDVTFFGDQRSGEFLGPSSALAADKARVRLEPHPALVRARVAEHRRHGLESSDSTARTPLTDSVRVPGVRRRSVSR